MTDRLVTNSLLRAQRFCPRSRYLGYDCALESTEQSDAKGRGSAFHAELAGVEYEANPYIRAAVQKAVAAFKPAEAEHVTITEREVEFVCDVDGMLVGGTIDALGRDAQGRLWIVERKTTTDAEKLMASLDLDTQCLTYWIGASALGLNPHGILYSVQPWPGERPYKATPVEKRKYLKSDPTKLYANQREHDETPAEYAARLTFDAPIFREVPILADTLEDHITDLKAQVWHLDGPIYRNPQSCGDCDFVAICRQPITLSTPPPAGFRRHSRVGSATHQPLAGSQSGA